MTDTQTAQITAAHELISQAIAKLQQAQYTLEGMDTAPTSYKIDAPWLGQNTIRTDDDYSNSDCGPACVAMWVNSRGKTPISVDDASKATGLPQGYKYTIPGDLIKCASAYGLNIERVLNLTPDSIRAEIKAGRPLIVLVHYGSLPVRYDKVFQGGHYILIVGCDATNIYYNDPYWPTAQQGGFISITPDQLATAMKDCLKDGNTANQGLRLKAAL